ncbi:MAG: DNA polymerase III subunit beta [Acidobacteria bacterium]|uniref:Beta sliding clamp n=1 Tax=Candidatus Polarisedimenticola svalbardensis TaxID=2886004 RepID=A0A8J7C1T8_9BACT|nr:DNA polymerase III subunit beta [Candidatus Polarisedimenticola svalbardensis]
MEFVIRKNDLVHELQTIAGVVEKRATLPILSNLFLEAKEDGLHIRASDLEVNIRGAVKATVVQNGTITLPAAKLLEISRSLPDAEVQFKLRDNNQMAISCERSRFKLAGQLADDFPDFPELGSVPVSLPGKVLRSMVERVSFAITMEDPRYSLNGALLKVESSGICLVATDGHRLAYCHQEMKLDVPKAGVQVIVPRKALAEVLKLSADFGDDDKVEFGMKGNHVFFRLAGHELVSTIPEGPFPSYENVMPEACAISVPVPTADLLSAVRRVALMASDRYGKAVRFALSSGKLELSYESDMGNAQESLPVEYDGESVEIGFNARYFQDFLNVVGTDNVLLELDPVKSGEGPSGTAGDKPGQLRPEPSGNTDYRYIVMPMHLL